MKKTAIAALTMFGVIGMLSTQSYAANFSEGLAVPKRVIQRN